MSSHTPGPWEVIGATVYALQHAGWNKGVEVMENRFFSHLSGKAPSEELQANARLIAAAPDLLAALQDAAEGFCHYCRTVGDNTPQGSCGETPSCGEREQTWLRAIAKATT